MAPDHVLELDISSGHAFECFKKWFISQNLWAELEDLTEDSLSKDFIYEEDYYETLHNAGTYTPSPVSMPKFF